MPLSEVSNSLTVSNVAVATTRKTIFLSATIIVISSFMEEQVVRVLLYTVYIFVKRSADHIYIDKIIAERH